MEGNGISWGWGVLHGHVSSFIIIGMSRGVGGLRKDMDVDIF